MIIIPKMEETYYQQKNVVPSYTCSVFATAWYAFTNCCQCLAPADKVILQYSVKLFWWSYDSNFWKTCSHMIVEILQWPIDDVVYFLTAFRSTRLNCKDDHQYARHKGPYSKQAPLSMIVARYMNVLLWYRKEQFSKILPVSWSTLLDIYVNEKCCKSIGTLYHRKMVLSWSTTLQRTARVPDRY